MDELLPLECGKYYHVYNRGNNRENLFKEARNYDYFLKKYWEYISPVAETFAYCLLPNHFHLLVKIREEEEIHEILNPHPSGKSVKSKPNPIQQFSNFFNSYTKSINKAYNRSGNLFKRPFQRKVIENEEYLITLILYIHLNPQRHGLRRQFQDYPYSSYLEILANTPTKIERVSVLELFHDTESFLEMHQSAAESNEEVVEGMEA